VSIRSTDVAEFADVDGAEEPRALLSYLEVAKALPGWRRAKQDAVAALRLGPGDQVLDIGCGYGADVLELAPRVGRGGAVIGLDISDAMIAEAVKRARGLDLSVAFHVGDARDLRFDDASFDACRAETLLQHVPEPDQAVAEMVRVLKPGGRIVLLDMDLGTLVIDSDDATTTSTVLNWFSTSTANGWIGRQLPRLLKDAGLDRVEVGEQFITADYAFMEHMLRVTSERALADGRLPGLTASDLANWWSDLDDRNRAARYFGGGTAFIAWATKPI
jgi:ubiquinone/menaquinone biosynthesis C-methylase UbiE